MSSAYHLRTAQFDDLDAILDLWVSMMDEHQQGDPRIRLAAGASSAYRSYAGYHLASSESHVTLAETEDGQALGFCLLAISRNLPMFLPARYGYLSDLAVRPDWRRQGIGRALVEHGAAWLRGQGVDSIQLQYYAFNERGAAFWQAMGFEPFYTRMWRTLA